jgi:hypothetical protein
LIAMPRSAAAGVLAAALVLSGCAAQNAPNPYATATAADLQQSVLHVTEAAGDGDLAAALTRLHELEVAAKVAHARGEMSEARKDSILSAVALVRADLEAMIAEAKRKAEEEAKRKAAEEARKKAEAEQRKAEEEAARRAAEEEAQRVAAEQAAQEQAEQQQSRENDKGNGKNKGKGRGGNGGNGDDDGDDDGDDEGDD